MSQSSSVRRFPKWSWVVEPFPCFTVVKPFLNWYACLLSRFFIFFFFFKLTTLFSHPVSFCLFFALLDISLVTRWFESSQPQTITSGPNTNFTLSPSYPFHKSSDRKSFLFFCLPIYIPRALNTGTCIRQGHLFILRAHSQHRKKKKNRERFCKKCRWMDPKGRNKEEIHGSMRSMHGYILTYSRL